MKNRSWTVVQHSGQHMVLECGTERKDIQRPSDPVALKIFTALRPGQSIDDATLQHFLGVKP